MVYKYCYFNGKIVEFEKTKLPLNELAVLRGFSAFDFMRVYNGNPFRINDHLARFFNSAKLMGIKIPATKKQIEENVLKLIQKNAKQAPNKNFQVRFLITGGVAENGLMMTKPNLAIYFERLVDFPKSFYEKGQKIITHEYERFLPEAKSTNYIQAVMLQKQRKQAGAIEILYTNRGVISEATTSNIFYVKSGVLYTPVDGILEGITKKTVIEITERLGIRVISKIISIKDLYDADEVLPTATNKKVLPIVQINGVVIGIGDNNGKVGSISKRLLEEYNHLTKSN